MLGYGAVMAKDLTVTHVRVTPEQRKRLEHHASRLGMDMTAIIREGLIEKLEALDEKEMKMLQVQRLRERDSSEDRNFRRWAEFLDGAKSRMEREQRREIIEEDVEARSPQEARSIMNAFDDYLKTRS